MPVDLRVRVSSHSTQGLPLRRLVSGASVGKLVEEREKKFSHSHGGRRHCVSRELMRLLSHATQRGACRKPSPLLRGRFRASFLSQQPKKTQGRGGAEKHADR